MAAKKKPIEPTPPKNPNARSLQKIVRNIDNMTSIRAGIKQADAYKKNNLNRKDASGNKGFGNSAQNVVPKGPQGQTPASAVPSGYKPNWKGSDWKPSSPYNPKNTPKIQQPDTVTGSAQALPKVTPNRKNPPPATPSQPRGMAQTGKLVPSKSESMAKKKKK